MATPFKEGDRVQIVDREPTAEDTKSGLFYGHFRGLTGTVQKVYANQEVAIEVEAESLREDVEQRHEDVREQMKSKWLDGLSEEGRNRLTEAEKDFRLRYTVLVMMSDLTAPGKKVSAAKPQALSPARPAAPAADSAAPRRPTSADLEAAEQAYLQNRQRNGDGS